MFTSPVQTLPGRTTPWSWPRAWLITFLAILALFVLFADLARIVQFAWNSSQTEGTVVALDSANHNSVRVRYVVDGHEYTIVSSSKLASATGPVEYVVGQSVPVYFLRSEPEDGSLQPPRELVGSALTQAALLAGMAASLVAWSLYRWQRRRSDFPD